MTDVAVRVLGGDLTPVALAGEGVAVEWTRAWPGAGGGSVTAPATSPIGVAMRDPEHSLIVEVGGAQFGAGRCQEVKAPLSAEGTITAEYGGLAGELAHVLAYPEPTASLSAQPEEYEVSGPLETVVLGLIAANSAREPVAAVHRWVTPADQGRGPTVAIKARWVPVADALKDVWGTGGLIFEAYFAGSPLGGYAPAIAVRESASILPALDHDAALIGGSPEWAAKPAAASHVVAGGAGEGAARLLINDIIAATGSKWRREAFLDLHDFDATETPAIYAAGARHLAEAAARASVTGVQIPQPPTATAAFGWGVSHDVGDILTLRTAWGATVAAPVTGITLTAGEGVRLTHTVGEATLSTETATLREVRAHAAALRRIQGGK